MSLQLIPGRKYATPGKPWPRICPHEGKNPLTGQVVRFIMFEWENGSMTGMGDWPTLEIGLNEGLFHLLDLPAPVAPVDVAAVALSNAVSCSLLGLETLLSAPDLTIVREHLLQTLGEDLEEQGFVFSPKDDR